MKTVTPDRGTTLNISTTQVKGCKVCTVAGGSRKCTTSLLLKDNKRVQVEFDCSRPQDVFSVEVVQNIECTTKSCSSHIIQAESGSLPLLDFARRFTWNLKASALKAFKIDFTSVGLRQINASERCPDRHSYTIHALQSSGDVAVGTYCRTGPISSAQILNRGSFAVEVPAGQKLQNGQFHVSVGEEIKSLAKITLTLPKGTSSAELLSPNYPGSFPDDDVMEWYFQVPDKQKATVELLNLTQPLCRKKDTEVVYQSRGGPSSGLRLTDTQPQREGNFTLTLRNCEMDRSRAGSPGLSLNLRVSTSSKMEGLSLHIEKRRSASDCELRVNSASRERITVTSNSELTFQDCLPEDLQVTATRVIECRQLKDCSKTPVRLSVPLLPPCLPAPLSSVTWTLRPPEHSTVELTSPAGNLKQCLPGQRCNDSFIIKMTEDDGTTVGRFCPHGVIQKVQIHTNVSVSVSGTLGGKAPPVLYARMKGEITERYIFSVSPKRDAPALLASPGWPEGMKSYSTVSWIVTVPQKMEARLMFANLSQPKCGNRHTNIRVQRVGRLEEDYSRREDEMPEEEITVSESFYLNMSNCMPERGEFSVITKITLQKSISKRTFRRVKRLDVGRMFRRITRASSLRKKKKKLSHQVSIYNPNGTSFLPGQNGFPETREDNDEHEYASIEDTLVYTHLLRKGKEIGVYGDFDTYQPFTGRMDSQKPLVSKDSIADDRQASKQPFAISSQQAPPLPIRPLSHDQQTFFFFPQERDFAPKPWTEKHCVQTRLQLLPYFLSDEGCI
uniref:CUB domain containing protein 1a n=1 Tax=Sparus aurata TaxID=8175 RepID=A0A671W3X9_SPAAU